ncbi:MAG: AraC family transcriptional regulator [Eubacteriales bacterium]|nr:AraC family transcriptional regulator [Eubacteriales bacterium]
MNFPLPPRSLRLTALYRPRRFSPAAPELPTESFSLPDAGLPEQDVWRLFWIRRGSVRVSGCGLDCHRGTDCCCGPGSAVLAGPEAGQSLRLLSADPACPADITCILFLCGQETPVLPTASVALLSAGEPERSLFPAFLEECETLFGDSSPEEKKEQAQLCASLLETLLLLLLRRSKNGAGTAPDDPLYQSLLDYLRCNLSRQLSVDQICRDNRISRSRLQRLFLDRTGNGVIHAFSSMKIEEAKRLIPDWGLNFSQIADRLGYRSVHYFSRQFKQFTGMTPSAYAAQVRKVVDMGAWEL